MKLSPNDNTSICVLESVMFPMVKMEEFGIWWTRAWKLVLLSRVSCYWGGVLGFLVMILWGKGKGFVVLVELVGVGVGSVWVCLGGIWVGFELIWVIVGGLVDGFSLTGGFEFAASCLNVGGGDSLRDIKAGILRDLKVGICFGAWGLGGLGVLVLRVIFSTLSQLFFLESDRYLSVFSLIEAWVSIGMVS